MAARRVIPLLDRVLIQRVTAPTKSIGGVLLPEAATTKLNEGTVVEVGPGARNKDGAIIPPSVKKGDRVLLPEYGGSPVKLGEAEFVLYRNDDLLGLIENK